MRHLPPLPLNQNYGKFGPTSRGKIEQIKKMLHLQMVCSKFAIEVNPFFRPVSHAVNRQHPLMKNSTLTSSTQSIRCDEEQSDYIENNDKRALPYKGIPLLITSFIMQNFFFTKSLYEGSHSFYCQKKISFVISGEDVFVNGFSAKIFFVDIKQCKLVLLTSALQKQAVTGNKYH